MATRDKVLSLLRGPVVSRIRFTFPFAAGTVTIAPQSFHRVATAIEAGTVSLQVTNTFPPGVGGQYISGTPNTLQVAPLVGRTEEGLLLHECTHAIFDLTKTQVTDNEDEAAAYVVDALYFRMTGLRRSRWNAEPHATAGSVADDLLRQYQAGKVRIPPVDTGLWATLRRTVMLDPLYIGGTSGILGVLFGTGTGHDG
ncbi:hypothetical protein [Vineibacter terrae]|uniref:hypothetical protein n=1 Tax=Vineibacter terrae TaxID=2586908 RepID=UPI002E38035D|nr:hypothetical protein [Vineibacter terrae]HEX2891360.1 hypothetical protein [Vineibacter terrae]